MSHVSFRFKKTNKAVFQQPATALTADNIYWKQLGAPTLVKELGAIDYLQFSPVEPYYFAATCSVRVQVYDPITKMVVKTISQFKESAYGGTFRSDGKLLASGCNEGVVKLFDASSKRMLRVFAGHTGPVHRTYFTKDQKKILSCSDDKSVILWDISEEKQIVNFTEHNDYIRAGSPSPISDELFLTGSYDNTVKLFDTRVKEAVVTVNHGSPVESTLFLQSGGIFISAGGTEIKVWDIFNAGKLLASMSQHHKTVTSLCLASNSTRLLSASLDRHVKVFDIGTFGQVHSMDYPNAILSMAISENDDMLVVGMIDGIISISKRKQSNRKAKKEKQGLFKFAPDTTPRARKKKWIYSYRTKKMIRKIYNTGPPVDMVVKSKKAPKSAAYDKHLRKMEFGQALAVVLVKYTQLKHPEITTSLLQELLRRKVLHIAYEDLPEVKVEQLLKYFSKYIGDTRFTPTIIDAANVFVDVFDCQMQSFSVDTLRLYRAFVKNLKEEIDVCQKVCELEGAISLLLAGAQITTDSTVDFTDILIPSANAQKEIVIDV